jgi:flagellar biosynthesis component FlhA
MKPSSLAPLRIRCKAGASLYSELTATRESLELVLSRVTTGFHLALPPLAISRDDELEPRSVWFEALERPHTIQIERGLPPGTHLVRAAPLYVQSRTKLKVEPWPDPFRPTRSASIVLDSLKTPLEQSFPDSVLTAAEVIAVRMGIWFRRFASEWVDAVAAAQLLATLPPADSAALLRACAIDAVVDLLKLLVQDGVQLADFGAAAPLLADESRVHWTNNNFATAAIPGRIAIAAPRPADEDERRHVIARTVLVAGTLWQRAGTDSLDAWTLDELEGWVPAADASTAERAYFEQQLGDSAAAAAQVHGAVLICSQELRTAVANALRKIHPELMVVARHELPRNIPSRPRGRIRIQPYEALSAERRSA